MASRPPAPRAASPTDRPSPRPPAPPADRLDAARRLWHLVVATCVLATLTAVGVGAAASFGADARPALVQSLALTAPGLTPAGSPARTPASHPSIEGGLLPGVDRLAPPPARLLTDPGTAP